MLRRLLPFMAVFAFGACKASFMSVKKDKLLETTDNLDLPQTDDNTNDGKDQGNYETLKVEHELSKDESLAHGCKGRFIITETGPDRNRDKILQSTEVTDITTKCIPNANTSKPNDSCPGQSGRCSGTDQKK